MLDNSASTAEGGFGFCGTPSRAAGAAHPADTLRQEILSRSPCLLEVLTEAAIAAKSECNVLLCGETGVGKEVVAHFIHKASPRSAEPLVVMHCGGLADTLVESELFGHVRGAFTGADRKRDGFFTTAHNGTLFLDEIGAMPVSQQAKLLRVLQDGVFYRVGSTVPETVDVRIVAATNTDPLKAAEAGTLKQDLYYRLNEFPIEIPPLRHREADILPLAEYFLAEAAGTNGRRALHLSEDAAGFLLRHAWPGNVRELKNAVGVAFLRASAYGAETVEPNHFKIPGYAFAGKVVVALAPVASGEAVVEGQWKEEPESALVSQIVSVCLGSKEIKPYVKLKQLESDSLSQIILAAYREEKNIERAAARIGKSSCFVVKRLEKIVGHDEDSLLARSDLDGLLRDYVFDPGKDEKIFEKTRPMDIESIEGLFEKARNAMIREVLISDPHITAIKLSELLGGVGRRTCADMLNAVKEEHFQTIRRLNTSNSSAPFAPQA